MLFVLILQHDLCHDDIGHSTRPSLCLLWREHGSFVKENLVWDALCDPGMTEKE